MRPRVLFLCTGNSCRSQIAEGWARHLHGEVMDSASAGTNPQGLNPLAVRVMAEAGVDISRHASNHLDSLRNQSFDLVITVCDSAHEACPTFPGAKRTLHVPFDDPPKLAEAARTDDEALPRYRRVRDEIRAFIQTLPALLAGERTQP